MKHFGKYVFQPSIADFVVVDGKDTKNLTVDIPTFDYQEVQKTLDVSEILPLRPRVWHCLHQGLHHQGALPRHLRLGDVRGQDLFAAPKM